MTRGSAQALRCAKAPRTDPAPMSDISSVTGPGWSIPLSHGPVAGDRKERGRAVGNAERKRGPAATVASTRGRTTAISHQHADMGLPQHRARQPLFLRKSGGSNRIPGCPSASNIPARTDRLSRSSASSRASAAAADWPPSVTRRTTRQHRRRLSLRGCCAVARGIRQSPTALDLTLVARLAICIIFIAHAAPRRWRRGNAVRCPRLSAGRPILAFQTLLDFPALRAGHGEARRRATFGRNRPRMLMANYNSLLMLRILTKKLRELFTARRVATQRKQPNEREGGVRRDPGPPPGGAALPQVRAVQIRLICGDKFVVREGRVFRSNALI